MKVGSLIKKIRLMLNSDEENAQAVEPAPAADLAPSHEPKPMASATPTQQPIVQHQKISAVPAAAPTPQPARNQAQAPRKPSLPATPVVGIKEHSDCILQLVGENAKAFVGQATQQKMISPATSLEVFHRQDVIALILGYKLTGVAYRMQHKEPSREVLRMVRVAMVSMLLKAGRDQTQQLDRKKIPEDQRPAPFTLEIAEEYLKSAEKEVIEAVQAIEAGTPNTFTNFYLGLTPTFSEDKDPGALEKRFGPMIKGLLANIQQTMIKQLRNSN